MASNFWRGDAQPIAQVNTITVGGTAAVSQTYTVTINRKEVTYTATGTDTNDTIAASLQALLAASTLAEFQEVIWTYPGTGAVVTGTAKTPGVPFTNTSGSSGTGTLVTATATASRGPLHLDDVDNWSAGSLPVNGDDVYFQDVANSALYGLTALSGVSLATFNVLATFTGRIGLPEVNPAGYVEYRTLAMQLGGNPTVTIGNGDGDGSSLIRLRVGTGTCTVLVKSTGSTPQDAPAAVVLTNAGGNTNVLTVLSGSVAVATGQGETATINTITVGGTDPGNLGAPSVTLGPGTTVGSSTPTVALNSGSLISFATVATLNQIGGTYTQQAGSLTNVTCQGGTVVFRSTGTTTQATFRNVGSVCDCRQDPRARTFTNASFTAGAALYDPTKSVTLTNPATFDIDSLNASDIGRYFTLQRT